MIFPGASSFRGMRSFLRPLEQFATLIGQQIQTAIGRKHPKIINAARESAIARCDKSLHRRFSMNSQMWTPHLHLMWSLARSPFLLRSSFRSSIPNFITNVHQHQHLTTDEKRRRRGLYHLKMADSRAASMVFGCLRLMLVCRCWSYECLELCQ